MKILFTGGGTAGHIYPIIAIVREMKKNEGSQNFQFFYIGPEDKFISSLLSQEGIQVKTILAGKLRRYFSFQNIIDILFRTPIGILQAFFHIFIISPDCIFSKGGYGSIPAVIAGWILWVPIFIHESDVASGLANRIGGKLATEIFGAFPIKKIKGFSVKKIISVGNPIREEILQDAKNEAPKIFQLTGGKPLILFLGGSQGAQILNNVVLLMLSEILNDFEIIHQTGKDNFEQVNAEAGAVIRDEQKKYYHPAGFLNEKELASAYQSADLVISRAGAGSIFEIAALGKPSILVPLAGAAQEHQVKNAYAFAERETSVVIEEVNLTPHFLLERIKNLISSPDKLKEMAKGAKEFSRPDAARIIAGYLVAYLTQ